MQVSRTGDRRISRLVWKSQIDMLIAIGKKKWRSGDPIWRCDRRALREHNRIFVVSTVYCFDRVQQESSFPACTTHSTAFFTPLRAIRRWKPYKRPSQRTWTLARRKKHMGNIAQGLRTCPYQEPTAQRPVSLSRSRFTCTASRSQILPQRALASEKIKRGSWGGRWSVFAHLD